MRQCYIVTYDISDDRRLRQVFKIMRGWGDHLQYSVFRCALDRSELAELREVLGAAIHHGEDQVLFVDVGPADGRGAKAITSIGKPHMLPENHAIVL